MLRVSLKDDRVFEGTLDDLQYDAYKREGWFALDVEHIQQIFLFKECARVVDLEQPDVDLLPAWQGMVAYPTSPVRMERVETIGPASARPPLSPPSSCPTPESVTAPTPFPAIVIEAELKGRSR